MTNRPPNYSDVVGSGTLERATEIAAAMNANPLMTRTGPGSDVPWTVDQVLALAMQRGLDALTDRYVKPVTA